ncbi:MAG TPA: hypothetical protein VIG99_23350 [Myxococcaceae bacterium]|jgi:hypothetical protein
MSRLEPNTTELLPCPTPVPGGKSALAVERLVFCPLYQGCLDMAVHSGWEDFTCRRCPLAPRQATPSAAVLATRQPRE